MKLEVIDKSTFNLLTVNTDNIDKYYFITKIIGKRDVNISQLKTYDVSSLIRKLKSEHESLLVRIEFERQDSI